MSKKSISLATDDDQPTESHTDDDLESWLEEEHRRVEALSPEEFKREHAREILSQCWGGDWPLYANDNTLLTQEELGWKRREVALRRRSEEVSW